MTAGNIAGFVGFFVFCFVFFVVGGLVGFFVCLLVFIKNVVKMLNKELRRPRFNLWPGSVKVFSNILWAAPFFYPSLSGKMKIKMLHCVRRHV